MKRIISKVLLLAGIAGISLLNDGCSPTPVPGCADNITTATLSTGLVAYYKFPSSGAQLNDYGGNGFHLTNVGAVVTDINRALNANCAMKFNGTNYLQAPAGFPGIGAFSTTPFTVMVTYKPDAALIGSPNRYPILIAQVCGAVTPAVLANPSSSTNFVLGIDSCKSPFGLLWPTSVYAGAPCWASDSIWHNAAITWDGVNTIKVYQFTISPSSQYAATFTSVPLATSCSTPTTIFGYGFKGIIDDVKVWNRVLTTAELNAAFGYDSPCCP